MCPCSPGKSSSASKWPSLLVVQNLRVTRSLLNLLPSLSSGPVSPTSHTYTETARGRQDTRIKHSGAGQRAAAPAQLLHSGLAGGLGTKHSVQEGTGRQFPSGTTSTSLCNHEAILGAQQSPLLFPFHEEIPQFGGGEGDECLLPVVQTCLLEPRALKALRG